MHLHWMIYLPLMMVVRPLLLPTMILHPLHPLLMTHHPLFHQHCQWGHFLDYEFLTMVTILLV